MVFLGDDVEMYLVCEGRETWRVTGKAVRVLVCPNCGGVALVQGAEGNQGDLSECLECDTLVREDYRDAWMCSECGSQDDLFLDREEFVQHVETDHPPTLA